MTFWHLKNAAECQQTAVIKFLQKKPLQKENTNKTKNPKYLKDLTH
jgi:hypothetical protein